MRRALMAGLLAVTTSACGVIWGFEDPLPLHDSGDALSGLPDGAAAGATADGSAGGASADGGSASACTCLAPPEPSWQGPLAFFEGADTAPSCGPNYATPPFFDGFAARDAAPVAACACSCGPPTGVCSAPTAALFMDDRCMKAACASDVTLAAGCTSLDSFGCGGHNGTKVMVTAPVVVDAGCAVLATVDPGPPPWAASARLCATSVRPDRQGCAATQICMPAAAQGFAQGTYCVARMGVSPCPTSDYTVPHTFYKGFEDARGCAPCTCDAPQGVACNNASVVAYGDTSCGSASGTSNAQMGCVQATSVSVPSSGLSGGSCVATGGQPQGDFAPTLPWTICCTR